MALNLQRLFQWGKTPKPPYDLSDQPYGHPNSGDDLDAELDRVYANDADLTENKLSRDGTQTMTGNLDMDGNRVQNLPLPVNGAEPARKQELDTETAARQNADTSLETNKLSRDGSQTMTGDLDVNGNRIQNLPAPSGATEPARKQELDAEATARQNADTSLETSKLSRDGTQTMTGTLDVNGNRIQNLPAPSGVTEPARKQELDDLTASLSNQDATFLKLDGSRAMSGNLDMDGNQIQNVANPTAGDHAMPRSFADSRYVNTSGDTMTGDLDLGGNNILGLQSAINAIQVNQASNGAAKFGVYTNDSNPLILARQDGNAQLAVRDGQNILKRRYDSSGSYIGANPVLDNQNSPGAYGLQLGYNSVHIDDDLYVSGLANGVWMVGISGYVSPGTTIRLYQGQNSDDDWKGSIGITSCECNLNAGGIFEIIGTEFYVEVRGQSIRSFVWWMKIA